VLFGYYRVLLSLGFNLWPLLFAFPLCPNLSPCGK